MLYLKSLTAFNSDYTTRISKQIDVNQMQRSLVWIAFSLAAELCPEHHCDRSPRITLWTPYVGAGCIL